MSEEKLREIMDNNYPLNGIVYNPLNINMALANLLERKWQSMSARNEKR